MPKTKGLSPERAEAAREYIRALVDRDFGGVAWGFAKQIEVSQSAISDFLAGRAGIGLNVLEKVADYACTTIDEVVGRSGVPMGRDLDKLEHRLVELLAAVRHQKRSRSPSGFPPSAPSMTKGNVLHLHGSGGSGGKRRKKS